MCLCAYEDPGPSSAGLSNPLGDSSCSETGAAVVAATSARAAVRGLHSSTAAAVDTAGRLSYALAVRSLGGTLLGPTTERSLCSPTHQIGGITGVNYPRLMPYVFFGFGFGFPPPLPQKGQSFMFLIMPETFWSTVSLLSGTLSFQLWKADLYHIVELHIYSPESLEIHSKWAFPSCFLSLSELSKLYWEEICVNRLFKR